jgi:hypothetical protein
VSPAYLKDFRWPISQMLWNQCVDTLTSVRQVIFLGYSLPVADLLECSPFRLLTPGT